MLQTPVLFLVFNRLDTTKQVFAQIRGARPRQLFIGADGARAGKEGEAEKVQAVRDYLLASIDWECEVKTLFREENLGCGVAPAQAITWFFEQVEQGIILEDDCLPDASFFTFCETLLDYYKYNDKVMQIGGNNYFNKEQNESYYFSKYIHPPHGWASWRRAWAKYDFDMQDLPHFLQQKTLYRIIKTKKVAKYWEEYFHYHTRTNLDAWDTQWQFILFLHEGVAIMPYLNLVTNIGYNEEATHTLNPEHKSQLGATFSIKTIKHPSQIDIPEMYDDEKIKYAYIHTPTLTEKLKGLVPTFVKKILKSILK